MSEWKLNPLDKDGLIFLINTLWKKIKGIIPTKTSQLTNDSGFKTTDTTYGVVSKSADGLAPRLPNETATTKYLRQDGTWSVPPNTTYGAATQSVNGLMTAEDKKKLDGIADSANKTTYTNNLAATVAGTALDAVQGKALDDKGTQMSVYKGEDGNLHFRDWTGADTVIPFSNSSNYKITFVIRYNIYISNNPDTISSGNKTIVIRFIDNKIYCDTNFFSVQSGQKSHNQIFGSLVSAQADIYIESFYVEFI